jgi:hypothetical protein
LSDLLFIVAEASEQQRRIRVRGSLNSVPCASSVPQLDVAIVIDDIVIAIFGGQCWLFAIRCVAAKRRSLGVADQPFSCAA